MNAQLATTKLEVQMQRLVDKLDVWKAFWSEARPVTPLILDSLRSYFRPYEALHRPTGLAFDLEPRCGDWFTFYECCVRRDYLRHPANISRGDTVLDIGGNFGAFSIFASHLAGEEGRVFCFEPSPLSFSRIKKNIRKNGLKNINVRNEAVGGADGTALLALHEKSALNSIFDNVDGRSGKSMRKVKVDVVSIANVINSIDGVIATVKIDCEGAEYEIMESFPENDFKRIRTFTIETHQIPGKSEKCIISKRKDNGFDIAPGNPFFAINKNLV